MRTTIITTLMTGLLTASGLLAAEPKQTPADVAKAIAPFVEETTVAVFHGDMSRLDTAPFASMAFELLPFFRSGSREEKAEHVAKVNAILAGLAQQGCNDVYVVKNLSLWEYPVALIVPLPEDIDESAVSAILEQASWLEAARLHGAFFAGDPQTRSRLEGRRPEPRPELAAAFEAAGDTGGQMIILPPKAIEDIVRLAKQLLPALPEGMDPRTPEVIGCIRWEAYGLNTAPETSLTAVVQMKDAESAAALHQVWIHNSRAVTQSAAYREVLPNCDEVMSMLTQKVKVEGDRLVLSIDKPDQVDTLLSALEKLVAGMDRLLAPIQEGDAP